MRFPDEKLKQAGYTADRKRTDNPRRGSKRQEGTIQSFIKHSVSCPYPRDACTGGGDRQEEPQIEQWVANSLLGGSPGCHGSTRRATQAGLWRGLGGRGAVGKTSWRQQSLSQVLKMSRAGGCRAFQPRRHMCGRLEARRQRGP